VFVSGRTIGQRAILKAQKFIGIHAIAGRFTPGSLTNSAQKTFVEPRALFLVDPRVDQQALVESSYANVPVIALCNSDTPLRYVDIAIPCNNGAKNSVGLMIWLLTREVLRLRGEIPRNEPWSVMPDLFFYRNPDEVEKEETQQFEAPVVADHSEPYFPELENEAHSWAAEVEQAPLGNFQ